MGAELRTIESVIVEHLGFDSTREPIGAVDINSGTGIISPSASGRILALLTASMSGFYKVGSPLELSRTPTIFKTANVFAAGSTTIWTPAAGKKFRLMAYRVLISGDAAMAAANKQNIALTDGGVNIGQQDDVFLPAVSGTTPTLYVGPWVIYPSNGYLSTAANNVLAVNLGFAITTGGVRLNFCGTEE